MKLSLYSYLFERDNLCYLYNSQTGLLTTISQPVYEKLYNNDFDSLSEEILKILHEKKVIVADDKVYDYYYSCRNIFLSSIGNRENLSLTIAPTKGCNFACPYCFEGEKENGFLCLKETGKDTVEIAVMGVLKTHHRKGIGRCMFNEAKHIAVEHGNSFIQVKTVQMGKYRQYDETNHFYLSLGFKEFELMPNLWDEWNPCQIYVMSL